MDIQKLLNQTSIELSGAYKDYKAMQDVLKDLKKELKNESQNNEDWIRIDADLKKLKSSKKDLVEQVKDLEKQQDQVISQLDQYKAVQDFAVEMEDKFSAKKDKLLTKLASELNQWWFEAEINYKNWRLTLTVSNG